MMPYYNFTLVQINIILDYDVYDDLVLSNFMFVCLYMSACLLFVQQIFRKQIGQFEWDLM